MGITVRKTLKLRKTDAEGVPLEAEEQAASAADDGANPPPASMDVLNAAEPEVVAQGSYTIAAVCAILAVCALLALLGLQAAENAFYKGAIPVQPYVAPASAPAAPAPAAS
jgi:hypothetical protein